MTFVIITNCNYLYIYIICANNYNYFKKMIVIFKNNYKQKSRKIQLQFSIVKNSLKHFSHFSFLCGTCFVIPLLNGKYTV